MSTARQYLAWMPDEEEALRLGVEAHGDGNWSFILNDERFGKRLKMRDGNAMKDKWRKMSQAGDPKDKPARRQSEPAAAERAHPAGDAAAGPQSERARKRPVVPLRASEFIWTGEVDVAQPESQCEIQEEEDAEMPFHDAVQDDDDIEQPQSRASPPAAPRTRDVGTMTTAGMWPALHHPPVQQQRPAPRQEHAVHTVRLDEADIAALQHAVTGIINAYISPVQAAAAEAAAGLDTLNAALKRHVDEDASDGDADANKRRRGR
jgi:Myb-like DNA-binding domain